MWKIPNFCNIRKTYPLYKPPSRKILRNKILPNLYKEAQQEIKTILSSVNNVSVPTHIWTSDSYISYVTVTCHCINENKLFTRVLNIEQLTEAHTGKNYCICNIKYFSNLRHKQTGSGANIKNAVNKHLKKYHHHCVAHTLNLSVNKNLYRTEQLKRILTKYRILVANFKVFKLPIN